MSIDFAQGSGLLFIIFHSVNLPQYLKVENMAGEIKQRVKILKSVSCNRYTLQQVNRVGWCLPEAWL